MADIAAVMAKVLVASLLELNSAMSGLALQIQISHLAWVDPIEQDHDQEHQSSIENVEEHLMAEQVSGVALDVLDNAEDASNED